ncbi:MAG: hypothetical protein ACTHON_00315 [Humibacter sp.]
MKSTWVRDGLLFGAGAVAVVGVIGWLIAAKPEETFVPSVLPLLPLLLLWAVRKRLQVAFMSPVWIIALTLGMVGFLGYFLADELAGRRGGSIVITLSASEKAGGSVVFAVSLLAFVCGALLVIALTKSRPRITFGGFEVSARARSWMLALCIIPLGLVVYSIGSDLLARDVYLAGGASRGVFGLGQQLATACVALLGYLVVAARGGQRFLSILLTLAYAATFFGLGSRRLALLPVVFVIGMLMARPTRTWLKLAVAGGLAVIALPLPLFLRRSDEHGLLSYASTLDQYNLGDVDWLTTLNNVLIAFPISAVTALRWQPRPGDYFWISVNPLPGEDAGWYTISQSLRLNAYTPFSTVGELWNYGLGFALITWAVIGIVAVWLDHVVSDLWAARLPFVGLAVLGLSALFAIQALQYNLRSSSRMLLYAVLIAIAGQVLMRWLRAQQSAKDRRAEYEARRRARLQPRSA